MSNTIKPVFRREINDVEEEQIDVSIVLAVKNDADTIEQAVIAIIDQEFDGNFEFIIVENGSTDKTAEILKKYKEFTNVKIINRSYSNVAKARNEGILLSKGEVIAFIDGDTVVKENWIKNGYESLIKNKYSGVLGVTGPIQAPSDLDTYSKALREALSIELATFNSPQWSVNTSTRFVSTVPTCNAFYLKSAFKERLFDENVLRGSDSKFAQEVLKSDGKLLYDSNVSVIHYPRKSLKSLLQQTHKFAVARGSILSTTKADLTHLFALTLAVLGIIWTTANLLSDHIGIALIPFVSYLLLLFINGLYYFLKGKISILSLLVIPIVVPFVHLSVFTGIFRGLNNKFFGSSNSIPNDY